MEGRRGYYNPKTNALKETGTYKVDEDGKVSIEPVKGGKYVLWKKTNSETTISVDKVELNVKGTYHLKATIKPDGAANTELTWKSENESIASVDQKSVITGKEARKIKITTVTGDKMEHTQ